MAILRQRWYLDVIGQRLVQDASRNLDAQIPTLTAGDTVDLELHTLAQAAAGGFRYLDCSALGCKVGLFGETDGPPTEGKVRFGFGATWSAKVAVPLAAADAATALNAVATITAAGGVTVALEEPGIFDITFNTPGARDLIVGDGTDAYPSPYAKTRRIVAGDGDTQEIQRVTFRQNPAASQFTWADLPAPTATLTVLSTGNNQVQKITFSTVPTGGQLLLTYGTATVAVPSTADNVDLQNLLAAIPAVGAGKVTVTGSFEDGFIIVFGGLVPTDVLAMTLNTAALAGPLGKHAIWTIDGPLVDDLLGDAASVPALVQILFLDGGNPWTVILQDVTLAKGRIEPESEMLPPEDRILGEAAAIALFGLPGINRPDWQPGISGLTGGGAANLNGFATAALPTGYVIEFIVPATGSQRYQLQATTAAEALPGIVEPLDFNADTNARKWVQV